MIIDQGLGNIKILIFWLGQSANAVSWNVLATRQTNTAPNEIKSVNAMTQLSLLSDTFLHFS